ncbi:MAG TPA: amino acid permease [Gemmatimonadales bacterium]|nr:amino acid permease [Gemmatimonadales bacterium]
MSQPPVARITYARRLGFFSGTMAVIGGIIGAGIFRTPATVAARVGSARLALGAWVVGGAIALIGAFCFGELGQRRPKAGGGYVYLRDAWGALPAFLYGWALLLVIATGAIAAVAVTFANYALALLGVSAARTPAVAIAAIVVLSAINYVGVKPAAVTQNLFTVLKLAALVALIAAGLFAGTATPLHRPLPPPTAPDGVVALVGALGTALVPILFTYGGWQQTNFIAEEIIEPEKNLPRALVLGVAVVIAVYLLANVAYLRVLGPAGLARSTAPAADVMRALLGPAGGTLIAAGIAISTFGFLNLVILVTPRVLQAMAADGSFFAAFATLHPVYRTPTRAILLQAAWAIVLTLSGTFSELVDYVAFGDWIFFGLTVAGLFVYRARDRQPGGAAPRSAFRVPGYPWTPALFVLAALYVVASSIRANPVNALKGIGLLALGVPVYWLVRARPRGTGR